MPYRPRPDPRQDHVECQDGQERPAVWRPLQEAHADGERRRGEDREEEGVVQPAEGLGVYDPELHEDAKGEVGQEKRSRGVEDYEVLLGSIPGGYSIGSCPPWCLFTHEAGTARTGASGPPRVWQRGTRRDPIMVAVARLANLVGTVLAALAVFVTGCGLMFMAFSSFVFVLGAGTAVSHVAGAVLGVFFGGLVAAPFAQRLRRLLRSG